MTGGGVSDYFGFRVLMSLPLAARRLLLADKGYDSVSYTQKRLFYGVMPIIPLRPNRTNDIPYDALRYRDLDRIEQIFNKLPFTKKSFLAFLYLNCHQVSVILFYQHNLVIFCENRLRRKKPALSFTNPVNNSCIAFLCLLFLC